MGLGLLNWKMHPQAITQPQEDDRDYKLRFASDGTFQITVFSDLHLAEYESEVKGPVQDLRTVAVVEKVLDHESNSQLVVLNGDLISGYGTVADNVTRYLDEIVSPIVKKQLPWASTYGNHDHQSYANSSKIYDREKTYNNSLTQRMVPGDPEDVGVSNYYLPVYAADGTPNVPEVILWFFDSRGGHYLRDGEKRQDWVHASVVEWFKQKNSELTHRYGKTIPSLAFFHIPIAAAHYFQKNLGVDPSKEPGQNLEDVVWQGQMYDDKTGHDVEFMRALSKTDGLLATFSGHDHCNDWCFKWTDDLPGQDVPGNNVNVCYGRHSGYGGYGDLARGGRHIVLKKDTLQKEVVTWIRLEDGWITENVTLNATYGHDEYHPVPVHLELKRSTAESIGDGLTPGINSALLVLLLAFFLQLRF
ncbi:hypothetical protein CNMCM7691_010113 [Aspergillus felis]|uniref:Calcineurin-like phosphoesterase domain-containing protein n=1 Tax=Aspergillus felis TaxID=1287682 RepID=A0A8H6V7S9_9EURO|nr:hypothetical protein CNMCM7691_010113 [Aspergillus felis]